MHLLSLENGRERPLQRCEFRWPPQRLPHNQIDDLDQFRVRDECRRKWLRSVPINSAYHQADMLVVLSVLDLVMPMLIGSTLTEQRVTAQALDEA